MMSADPSSIQPAAVPSTRVGTSMDRARLELCLDGSRLRMAMYRYNSSHAPAPRGLCQGGLGSRFPPKATCWILRTCL
jgi:hypothetical protein